MSSFLNITPDVIDRARELVGLQTTVSLMPGELIVALGAQDELCGELLGGPGEKRLLSDERLKIAVKLDPDKIKGAQKSGAGAQARADLLRAASRLQLVRDVMRSGDRGSFLESRQTDMAGLLDVLGRGGFEAKLLAADASSGLHRQVLVWAALIAPFVDSTNQQGFARLFTALADHCSLHRTGDPKQTTNADAAASQLVKMFAPTGKAVGLVPPDVGTMGLGAVL